VTAEGSTGAPLRQQIAEAIHAETCNEPICDEDPTSWERQRHLDQAQCAADAVVALLNLTEEQADFHDEGPTKPMRHTRLVTAWLPSTPPDTSSSETT
jgi:hypothetical protein